MARRSPSPIHALQARTGQFSAARDIRSDLIVLDALVFIAGLRARSGEKEGALELIGLIRYHPKTDPETIQNIERLIPQFVGELRPDEIHSAEEKGGNLDLANVMTEIIGN